MRPSPLAIARTIVVAATLSGCSTIDYAKPVEGFAIAVEAATAQFDEAQTAVEKRHLELVKADALTHPKDVHVASNDDCNAGVDKDPALNRCRLVLRNAFRSGETEPLSYPDPHLDLRALSIPLAAYAKNLSTIANTDVAGEVASAVAAAKSQVDKLAASIEAYKKARGNQQSQVGTRVAAGSGAVASLLQYGLTSYLEDQKLEALRAATTDMEPVLGEAAQTIHGRLNKTLASVTQANQSTKRRAASQEYETAESAFENATMAGPQGGQGQASRALDEWISASQTFDAARQADPLAVFKALSKAHGELAVLLRNGNADSTSFWAQLDAALDEIGKLAAIAEQFEAAKNATSDEKEE